MLKSGKGKTVRKVIAVTLLSAFLISCFSPIVLGAWTQQGYSGSWDNVDSPAYLSYYGWQDTEWANANFTYGNVGAIGDGEGVTMFFNYTIRGEKEWWWWEGTKRVAMVMALQNGSDWAYNWFYLAHEQGYIMTTSEIKVGKDGLCSIGKPLLGAVEPNTQQYIPTWVNGFQIGETVVTEGRFGLQIVRVNSTLAKIQYGQPIYATIHHQTYNIGGFLVWYEYMTVPSDFWGNPELKLFVGHEGKGNFTLICDEPVVGTIDEFVYQDSDVEKPAVIAWIEDALDFVFQMIGLFGAFIVGISPYIGLIVLLYFLDAGIKSAHTRSIEPIGYAFGTIYEWLMIAYERLLEIGALIWDMLTFWT
jgi:hypothetical protein